MNTAVLAIFSAFAVLCEYALTQPVKYDQRQEGDLNVRTDVEDVVFVMVMPQDLIAGMGLVAANAVDLLRKNYGGIGPERWPVRAPAKVGFVPLEKSPYKIDLEKSGVKVKKISQPGDPNRYNFQDNKTPTKVAPEVKVTTTTETPEKSTMEVSVEMVQEVQSTTESKTVKKVLKPEEVKKTDVLEEKKPFEGKKEEKINPESVKKSEELKKPAIDEKISKEPKVVGDNLDPTSIFRIEGCGPDAKRDSTGKCVYMSLENSSEEKN